MNFPASPTQLYLDLLKKSLSGLIYEDAPSQVFPIGLLTAKAPNGFVRLFREHGRDVPGCAHSSIGLRRLDNIQYCLETVLQDSIPGDLIETGVWRGGATILMRGVLKAYGITDRQVWVADSFEGLPVPDTKHYPLDQFWVKNTGKLAVTQQEVSRNFALYGLLDDQVRFLPGWFKETLPDAPIERLAVLRLDGDLYQSTLDALTHLYPKLSLGGFVIIDDFGLESCRQAVNDYRNAQAIKEPIQTIDWTGVYWRRSV